MATSNNTANTPKFNVTTGIRGIDAIPANAAVLMYEASEYMPTAEGKRERQAVTKFLAVEGVKSTKDTDLLIPVLALMLSDTRMKEGFVTDFAKVVVNGVEVKSGITGKLAYDKYLRGNVVWKTNSDGELTRGLVLDEGLKLSDTALKVRKTQAIFTAKGKDLKNIMHTTAKAICKQATMRKDLIRTAKDIYAAAYETEQPAKDAKDNKQAA